MKVYVVRRLEERNQHDKGKHKCDAVFVSAWPDPFGAKFEARRWTENDKLEHDVVGGSLAAPGFWTPDEEEVEA